ncbi:hypothetical protein C3K47_00110 [Solitalea longa]|uniref:DUF4199 domain-containing protein n=1 Tax=Solitalea longa TaxID=2079460 RepID=A0A2S5A994_9SPHI|nr:DUF4199 domain-containing protein [Solitalea longa]POY38942.1 hypothetical protein C3K47_00110 [Solitalea longa]
MIRTEFKWALVISLLNFIWLLLEYAVGLHDRYLSVLPYVTLFSIIIPVVFIRKALVEKRENEYLKNISFWQSMLSGSFITVVCSVISVFSMMIYFKLINPQFTDFMVEYVAKKAADNGENIAQASERARIYFSMKSYMQKAFGGTMLIGLLVTLFWSILIKRKTN